jgi:flagellin
VAGYNATKSIVASFTRSSAGAISIGTISVNTAGVKLYDAGAGGVGIIDGLRDATGAIAVAGFSVAALSISALTDSTGDLTTLESYIAGADKAISEMTTSASTLGATKQRVTLQKNFVGALMDAVERGISTLVDADMTEESTKLQALQVQQQLGVQSLSIANQQGQSILSLFR